MWLFTPFGFFSIVQKPDDPNLTVRGRTRGDLLRLRRHYLPQLTEPVSHEGTDYPWRATCGHDALAEAMRKIVAHIDYGNFKDRVALQNGKTRANRYAKVWQAMYGLEDDLPEPLREGFDGLPWPSKAPAGLKLAYGGVVVDPTGRLLLRKVANHYDGYQWTFAKGRPEPGEAPRQTALREVKEEMGINARILLPLNGSYAGSTTHNHFFLMVVDPGTVQLDFSSEETDQLRWALPGEARHLIGLTTNPKGRVRDLQLLDEALAALPSPLPLQRPIARLEDWTLRPMPAERKDLPLSRRFTLPEMARVVRGFLPREMEQKWFIYFEDGVLRFHRSWTGFEIFRLHLQPLPSPAGHWQVVRTEVNQDRAQFLSEGDTADLDLLTGLIETLLLEDEG